MGVQCTILVELWTESNFLNRQDNTIVEEVSEILQKVQRQIADCVRGKTEIVHRVTVIQRSLNRTNHDFAVSSLSLHSFEYPVLLLE